MTEKIASFALFIFGTNQSQRFRRFIILIIVVGILIMLILNITISYSKKAGISFQWKPAAEIKIEKK